MTIVVGYLPAKGGRASLDLAAELARSGLQEDLAVVTVVAQHWAAPSLAKVDAEFVAWTHQTGEQALDQARAYLAAKWPDVKASFHRAEGRSVPAALTQACEEHSGDLLVLGSSTDGRVGQVIVGSTAGPLLHSSAIPIAIAPRGYRAAKGAVLTRLTCAYSGTEHDDDLLTATARMGVRMGSALRIVTFAIRGRTMYPPEVGLHAEDLVLQQWKEQVQTAQANARARLDTLGLVDSRTRHRDSRRVTLGRGDGRHRLGARRGAGARVVAGRPAGQGLPRFRRRSRSCGTPRSRSSWSRPRSPRRWPRRCRPNLPKRSATCRPESAEPLGTVGPAGTASPPAGDRPT